MNFIFANCSSLLSLPVISEWNISNATHLNYMFSKCISLISLPDISKWKTQKLKEMHSLFSDCLSLLFIPDISKWNNYNKHDLNENPDYNRINFINDTADYYHSLSFPEKNDNSKDIK